MPSLRTIHTITRRHSHLRGHARGRQLFAFGSALALLAVACRDDAATAPRPNFLEVSGGDGQHGLAGSVLPVPVDVQLLDGKQQPLIGVHVTWTPITSGSDVIVPEQPTTDASGHARARWRLDATTGTHTIMVTADGGATAYASAYADEMPVGDVHPLPLDTYDGSGQAVHPDFVRLPSAWGGDPFRLVATPYPEGNAAYENPSLFTGSTGTSWAVPQGVVNPLEKPDGAGYLSDPDILYDPDANELRLYYRRVTTENEISARAIPGWRAVGRAGAHRACGQSPDRLAHGRATELDGMAHVEREFRFDRMRLVFHDGRAAEVGERCGLV